MRAAVLTELGAPLVVEEVELFPPGPHDVIVRTGAVEVCITDANAAARDAITQPPSILGHAACGIVEEVGDHVASVRPGDRVVVAGTPACGVCPWCIRGEAASCREIFLPTAPVARRADGAEIVADGGIGAYAERMRLRDYGVVAVESDLPDEHLCMFGCAVTAGLGAVFNTAGVAAGETVAVVGCGRVGLWIVQAALAAGASRIVAVEPIAVRRELAGRLGATDLVDPHAGDLVAQVLELTDGVGVDHGFEAAGTAVAIEQAFAMTRRAGTVVLTGMAPWGARAAFDAVELALGGRQIRSSQYGSSEIRRDLPRFVAMMDAGRFDPTPLIDRTFELEEINDVFAAARAHGILSAIVRP